MIGEKAEITQINPGECIAKFKYLVRSSSEALVSTISRQYHINVNIIFGNIELIGSEPLGGLVAILSGEPQDIEGALKAGLQAIYYNPKETEKINKSSYCELKTEEGQKQIKYYTVSKIDEILNIL